MLHVFGKGAELSFVSSPDLSLDDVDPSAEASTFAFAFAFAFAPRSVSDELQATMTIATKAATPTMI